MTAAAHSPGIIKRGSTGTPLTSVTDAAPAAGKAFGFQPGTGTFGYDANGNLRTDPYKGITTPITYNYLNLPQTINYGGGKSLTMVYDATGTKLRTTAAGPLPADNYIHDYAGGIEYRKGLLEAIYHEEGRVTPKSGGGWQYEYAIRDHLGNTRLTFADLNGDNKIDVTNTSSNEVLQENHSYPFGLAQNYSWMNAAGAEDVRYKFNGKELNEELGLYDYGLRWYDPAIGRWGAVDPLAEDYGPHSPYNYVLNSPMNGIDPNGGYVYFLTQTDAQRTANEWNTIYGARYAGQSGASRAFYVAEVQAWTVSTDKDGNLVVDKIKGTGQFRIMTNPEFDFNTDDYTVGLYDLLNTKDYNIKGSYSNSNDVKQGYGRTNSSTSFELYSGLPNSTAGKNVWANDFATAGGDYASGKGGTAPHTAGGIALHELLYHISPLGDRDELLPSSNQSRGMTAKGPDAMRIHYGIRRTDPGTRDAHGSGVFNITFSRDEKERLAIGRARTGKN